MRRRDWTKAPDSKAGPAIASRHPGDDRDSPNANAGRRGILHRKHQPIAFTTKGGHMSIFVAGLSYKTAPVELREKLAVHASKLRCYGCRVKLAGNLSEAVLVSTCNRVEIYGVAPKVNGNINHIFQHLSGSTDTDADLSPYLYVKEGSEAVRHLFSVTSGLDSLVIGETEITGQVKQSYQAAQ